MDLEGGNKMRKSTFTQRMIQLMKAEKDPFKSGESFTTLNNVTAREKEHHQLLREQGFPSEQPLEGARYQRYSEHTSDPDSPDGVNHNQPPWIVNEVSEMLYEIPDDDAPSSKIKKALINLNKRINLLKEKKDSTSMGKRGGRKAGRAYKTKPPKDFYGPQLTDEELHEIARMKAPYPGQPMPQKVMKGEKEAAEDRLARIMREREEWVASQKKQHGKVKNAEDKMMDKFNEMYPTSEDTNVEKGLGDVARKVGSSAMRADQALGRKMRQALPEQVGDAMLTSQDKVIDTALWGGDRAARGMARGAGKLTGNKKLQDFGKKPDNLGRSDYERFKESNQRAVDEGRTSKKTYSPRQAVRHATYGGDLSDAKELVSRPSASTLSGQARTQALGDIHGGVERPTPASSKTKQRLKDTGLEYAPKADLEKGGGPTPMSERMPEEWLAVKAKYEKKRPPLIGAKKNEDGTWDYSRAASMGRPMEKGLGDVARKVGGKIKDTFSSGDKPQRIRSPEFAARRAAQHGGLESDWETQWTPSSRAFPPKGPPSGTIGAKQRPDGSWDLSSAASPVKPDLSSKESIEAHNEATRAKMRRGKQIQKNSLTNRLLALKKAEERDDDPKGWAMSDEGYREAQDAVDTKKYPKPERTGKPSKSRKDTSPVPFNKAGGYPRQMGPTPPEPASKLTRRQKIENQNAVDYPHIEKHLFKMFNIHKATVNVGGRDYSTQDLERKIREAMPEDKEKWKQAWNDAHRRDRADKKSQMYLDYMDREGLGLTPDAPDDPEREEPRTSAGFYDDKGNLIDYTEEQLDAVLGQPEDEPEEWDEPEELSDEPDASMEVSGDFDDIPSKLRRMGLTPEDFPGAAEGKPIKGKLGKPQSAGKPTTDAPYKGSWDAPYKGKSIQDHVQEVIEAADQERFRAKKFGEPTKPIKPKHFKPKHWPEASEAGRLDSERFKESKERAARKEAMARVPKANKPEDFTDEQLADFSRAQDERGTRKSGTGATPTSVGMGRMRGMDKFK